MELSLWPSGRCTLLWVAFPSQLPPGAMMGGGWRAKGMVGTPTASPWSREGRILQGNARGGEEGEGGIAVETKREGRLNMRERHRVSCT